jgi:ribosomal protein L34E
MDEQTSMRSPASEQCAKCGAPFSCAMRDPDGGDAPCWCTREPVRSPDPRYASCLCPACLREHLDAPSIARE